jgi:hypothetical protein
MHDYAHDHSHMEAGMTLAKNVVKAKLLEHSGVRGRE